MTSTVLTDGEDEPRVKKQLFPPKQKPLTISVQLRLCRPASILIRTRLNTASCNPGSRNTLQGLVVELEELDDAELEAGSDSKAAGDDGDEDSWDAMLDDAEDDADDEADESDFEMDN
ncbi:hypothetical protein C8R48DRAFT_780315 [Suillus tomentosus]|nr:hypothetical protein C8R48DRAFT_780315 [Suillus tomentosus]